MKRTALFVICVLLSASVASRVPAAYKPNRVEVEYVMPSNPAHQQLYELLQEGLILERIKAYLSPLRLPVTLHLKTAGCDGVENAWYEEEEHTVTVCYEYLAGVLRNAPHSSDAAGVTREGAIFGPTIEVFLHEVGHAVFHLLHVPVFGREEDAADQLANILIVNLDPDLALEAVKGVGYMYGREALSRNPTGVDFADVHGVPAQRFYNLACIAYGKDPKLFAEVVEKGNLPESRAQGCEDEYKQVEHAFTELIMPYIDQSVRAPGQADWRLNNVPFAP